jgi:integrase/recombinase XerD
MALEAVQAQAGHASIESTRIYLHLADDWLASQYRKAAEAIDAQVFADHPITHHPITADGVSNGSTR